MGSKHRRKSKPARRHHAPTKAAADAQEQHVDAPDAVPHESAPLVSADSKKDENPDKEDLQAPVNDGSGERAVATEEHDADDARPATVPTEVSPPPITVQEARQVLERLCVAMLAGGMSPTRAVDSAGPVSVDTLEERLEAQDPSGVMELLPVQRRAIRVFLGTNDESGSISVAPLVELTSAATFRVEMLEFQIRQAILDRAGTKSRGKVDIQRVLAKIASSLPEEVVHVTSKDFEAMLEEKLGVSAGSSMLAKVSFARIVGHQFTHSLPKTIACPRSSFCAVLEMFVVEKPLSMDSVEGQLRHLVANHADLRASFRALDADGSGSISLDEFVSFLQREARMDYPRGVLSAFVRRFDLDGDGSLSYDEFVAFVSPKQFGIQVLTPFGMFYMAADRHELMGAVVGKIKTRMFWMQHNDLFATSTNPVYKPPLKLKVTDHFILTHHYGTLRLQYTANDPIGKVVKNGEMVVLVLEPGITTNTTDDPLPPFEYRLKPNLKRSIPPLLSWSLRNTSYDQTARVEPIALREPNTVKTRASKRTSNTVAGNTFSVDDGASVASTKTDATSQRSTSSSRKKAADGLSAHVGRRIAAKSRASRPLVVPQENEDTEAMCSQKGPLKTQLRAPSSNVADSVPGSRRPTTVPSSPEAASSSGYEYFDEGPDNPTDEDEQEEPECSEHENDDVLNLDLAAGDESAPPDSMLCVEDPSSDWDEDAPPPPYDG